MGAMKTLCDSMKDFSRRLQEVHDANWKVRLVPSTSLRYTPQSQVYIKEIKHDSK